MSDIDEKGNVLVTGHILIRDTETDEILVNTRGQYVSQNINDDQKREEKSL